MANLSVYMRNRVLNFMRNVAITGQAAVYVGLFVGDDGLDDGTLTSEVSGGSYARQLVGLTEATTGATSNAAIITFPTATGDWGEVTHVALLDALTEGNVIMHGELTTAREVLNGDTFKIAAEALSLTV